MLAVYHDIHVRYNRICDEAIRIYPDLNVQVRNFMSNSCSMSHVSYCRLFLSELFGPEGHYAPADQEQGDERKNDPNQALKGSGPGDSTQNANGGDKSRKDPPNPDGEAEDAGSVKDPITLAVALKDYGVSKSTLMRNIASGEVESYRKGEGNTAHIVSRETIASKWPRTK